MIGIYYRPPDQVEPVDGAFFLQLQEALRSQMFIPLGDFSHPDICCKSSMANCKQSRRILVWIEDNFLSQVIDSLTRENAVPDLLLTNLSELTEDIRIGDCL